MRVALTIFFGMFFCVSFAGYFVVSSVAAYITDTPAVVATAKDADLRGVVIDVIQESLRQEIADNPDEQFRAFVSSGVRVVIGRAMTDDWFYGVLETTYGGVVEVIEGGKDDTVVDLAARKRSLRDSLLELGEASLRECSAAVGSSCRQASAATRIRDQYRRGVRQVIAAIPSSTNLTGLIESLGPKFLPPQLAKPSAARRAGSMIGWIKWLLLAAAVLLLTGVVIANATSPARIMAASGAVLVAAAGLYLLAALLTGEIADDAVRAEFAAQLATYGSSDSVVSVAGAGAERTARAAIGRALGMRGLPIAGALFLGVSGIAGAIVLRRRR